MVAGHDTARTIGHYVAPVALDHHHKRSLWEFHILERVSAPGEHLLGQHDGLQRGGELIGEFHAEVLILCYVANLKLNPPDVIKIRKKDYYCLFIYFQLASLIMIGMM